MPRYRERLTPSFWVYLVGALIIPAVMLVFAPVNPILGVVLGVVLYGAFLGVLSASSAVIEVTDTQVRVSSARIPLRFVGKVTPYTTREQARVAAGPGLDARAWLCLRGWVATSIRIDVDDPNDPVPYWLCSTRNPKEFAAAIAKAQRDRHAQS